MNKIFTMIVAESEKSQMNKVMRIHADEIRDYQISKKFDLGVIDITVYIIVTSDEVFNKITQEMNGKRIH